MNTDNSQGLNRENSQSFRYNLQEMNFDTNFDFGDNGLSKTPPLVSGYGGQTTQQPKSAFSFELAQEVRGVRFLSTRASKLLC